MIIHIEFQNSDFSSLCNVEGIAHDEIIKWKNHTLQEMEIVMIHDKHPPYHFLTKENNIF